MKNEIQRYNANERGNHWAVATLFFMVGLSGPALLHPALFWLTNPSGGGSWMCILYPFLGLVMFVFFLGPVVRFAYHNRVQKSDVQWPKQWRDVVSNREENLLEVGCYNAGQKLLFWVLLLSMLTLLVTDIVIWRQCSSVWFSIGVIRLSALLHASATFILITSIIVHIYVGIWAEGSMNAMLYGKISRARARKHHSG